MRDAPPKMQHENLVGKTHQCLHDMFDDDDRQAVIRLEVLEQFQHGFDFRRNQPGHR